MPNVIRIPDDLDVRRNTPRQALKASSGAWNPGHHPELSQGGEAYVEKIRSETDERFEDAIPFLY